MSRATCMHLFFDVRGSLLACDLGIPSYSGCGSRTLWIIHVTCQLNEGRTSPWSLGLRLLKRPHGSPNLRSGNMDNAWKRERRRRRIMGSKANPRKRDGHMSASISFACQVSFALQHLFDADSGSIVNATTCILLPSDRTALYTTLCTVIAHIHHELRTIYSLTRIVRSSNTVIEFGVEERNFQRVVFWERKTWKMRRS